jgi:hypothetical protein
MAVFQPQIFGCGLFLLAFRKTEPDPEFSIPRYPTFVLLSPETSQFKTELDNLTPPLQVLIAFASQDVLAILL